MRYSMRSTKYGLDFVSDVILESEVRKLYDAAVKNRNNFDLHKNVLDPFMATFTAGFESLSRDEWVERESVRQFDKAIGNHLGLFHQNMLGNLVGWENQGRSGYWDLKSTNDFGVNGTKVFAEVKNKFNTMNSESQKKLYQRFTNALELPEYKGQTAYLIEVIPKTAGDADRAWAPVKRSLVENIRRITAKDIYSHATGDADSFEKLLHALPKVIDNVMSLDRLGVHDVVFADLFESAFNLK